MTKVIKYKRGVVIDDTYVYIGRKFALFKQDSKWANPYVIGKDGTREEVIEKYRTYLLGREDLMAALGELKDKTLICWCFPLACHGNVLIELAEELQ